MRLRYAALLFSLLLLAAPCLAAEGPSPEELATVLGNQDVQSAGDNAWLIEGQSVTLPQLLTTVLPEREARLKAIQASIAQRVTASDTASSAGALDAKRSACQQTAPASIERTKCYQELSMLRDAASQSNQSAADERRDSENQLAKLDQDIAAIEAFKAKYGAPSPLGVGSIPFQ